MFRTVKINSSCCCCVKLGQAFLYYSMKKKQHMQRNLCAAYENSVHLTKSTYRTLLYQLVVILKVFFSLYLSIHLFFH